MLEFIHTLTGKETVTVSPEHVELHDGEGDVHMLTWQWPNTMPESSKVILSNVKRLKLPIPLSSKFADFKNEINFLLS